MTWDSCGEGEHWPNGPRRCGNALGLLMSKGRCWKSVRRKVLAAGRERVIYGDQESGEEGIIEMPW